jgi:hypothetical protein
MPKSTQDKFEQWKLDELLRAYPGMSLRPVINGQVRFAGTLSFSAEATGLERIDDEYELEFAIPQEFPRELPFVREVTGRINKDFHTNADGSLCLGSPVRQHLELTKAPTLPGFVKTCVIPFLYGFSYREKHGRLPFGELDHGMKGIRKDFATLFGVKDEKAAEQMVRLAGTKKRDANKHPCPCGSGRRLGKCHNRRVNTLRKQLGRTWFREQYRWLTGK